MKRFFAKIGVLAALLWGLLGCGPTTHIITGNTETNVNVRDSINIIDSIKVIPVERYVDIVALPDTLHLETSLAAADAYYDTTFKALRGEIRNKDKVIEKVKIEFRDRWRDSIQIKETPIPYPVEVIKKVVPWWAKVLSVIGGITLVCAAFYILIKYILKRVK